MRFRCLKCHGAVVLNDCDDKTKEGTYICQDCKELYAIKHGVPIFLNEPPEDVVAELQGKMAEEGFPNSDIIEYMVHRVHQWPTLAELKAKAALEGHCFNYYEAIQANFEGILNNLILKPGLKVLEIGTGPIFYFLHRFQEMGCECWGLDICFRITDKQFELNNPRKLRLIVADMNDIPFEDDAFDIVFASATTHHSPNLSATIKEISRVLKKGGQALIINEPVKGIIKNWSKVNYIKERNPLIHENQYSIIQYISLAKKYRLKPRLFFPEYINSKIASGQTRGFRFGTLGVFLSTLWKVDFIAKFIKKVGIFPGLLLLGLHLVLLCEKR